MKNMSFGKLMAIFGGILVVVVIAAIAIITITNKQKQGSSVVTQRHQQQPQEQKPDVLGERLKAQQDSQAAQAASAAQSATQTQAVQQAIQQGTAVVIQRLDGVSTDVAALDQRITALEGKRTTTELVVKPKHKAKTSAVKLLAKDATPIPASSGYKVQSTVGNRAWVETGDQTDSVSVGEALPPVAKALRVLAVDADSGIVITTHAR